MKEKDAKKLVENCIEFVVSNRINNISYRDGQFSISIDLPEEDKKGKEIDWIAFIDNYLKDMEKYGVMASKK